MADIPIIIQPIKPIVDENITPPLPVPVIPNPSFNVVNNVPTNNSQSQESHIFRISIRSFLSIILTLSFVLMIFDKITVPTSLESLVVMCISFYFASKPSNSNIK